MKLKQERIEVHTINGQPHRIIRRTGTYIVREIHDQWLYRSRWWSTDEQRHYFRLHCDESTMEVFERRGKWYLERVWD